MYFHIKELEIPIYRGFLVVILTNNTEKLIELFPDFGDREPYAHTIYTEWKNRQGFVIILNLKNSFRKIYHGSITHECIHAAHMIARARGIEPDFYNDEPITYLAEFIADEVYELMSQKRLFASYKKP